MKLLKGYLLSVFLETSIFVRVYIGRVLTSNSAILKPVANFYSFRPCQVLKFIAIEGKNQIQE